MLKCLLSVLLLICTWTIQAQITNSVGVRQHALGYTSVNIVDAWSSKNNPGALAFLTESQLGSAYQNRFLVNELSTQSLAYVHHSGKGNLGLFIEHTGFNLFRTMQIGGVYGLDFSPRLGMGLTFNYHQTRFGDIYGVKHHFSANLGVQYKLNKNLSIGASAQNVNRSKVSDFENERLPTTLTIGVLYTISEKVLWLIDLQKEITSPLSLKSGLELNPHDNFDIRFGINSYPFQSSFGFGINLSKISFDFAAVWHAKIGLTPSFGFIYKF